MPYQKTFFNRLKDKQLLTGVIGANAQSRDFHVHEGEEMSKRITMNKGQYERIKKYAHDKQMWKLDEDPQGMGMPFKEFITEDSDHHLTSIKGRRIRYAFPNGYGLSVVMGDLFYTDEDHPYEMCPLLHGRLCYDAVDADNQDVYPHATDEELMIMIAKLQALPKHEGEEL
jgi:hypothetical protein